MNAKALFYNTALSDQLPCLAGLSLLALVNWALLSFMKSHLKVYSTFDIDLRRMEGGGCNKLQNT